MKYLFLLAAVVAISCQTLCAQNPNGAGTVAGGSYFNGNVDNINLYNGNVMANIPLFSRPGRELSTAMQLTYNSQGWRTADDFFGSIGTYSGGFTMANPVGWGGYHSDLTDCTEVGFGLFQATYQLYVDWIDGSGATHTYTYGPYVTGTGFETVCDGEEYTNLRADLFPVWLLPASGEDDSVARMTGDGPLIYFTSGMIIYPGGAVATRNGNYAPYNYSTGLLDDTTGRSVTISGGTWSGGTTNTYTVHDSTGTAQTYTLKYTPSLPVYDPVDMTSSSIPVLSFIELPNARSYGFEYDHVQGFLTKIILPGGGYIAYEYHNGNSSYDLADDYVRYRRVSVDGMSYVTWTYDRVDSGGTRTVTVTDPEGHQVVHTFASGAYETQTDWKENYAAAPNKTVVTAWTGNHPTTVTTQIGGVKQQQTSTWSGSHLIETTQSDWYPAASSVVPLTKTVNSLTTSSPYYEIFPSGTELQQWNGSSYVTAGKTEYVYDEYSLASVSGTVPSHGTPLFSNRYNVTTVRKYWDATHSVEEHFYYDVLGNVVHHVDARGKPTYFDFADNFTDLTDRSAHAYPKVVTDAVGHTVTTLYDFNTGLPMTIADPRSQATTMTYDAMDRPLTIAGPESSSVSYDYNDSTSKVTESVTVDSGKARITETSMDGLGRPFRTKLSDPGGSSYDVSVDTVYGGSGEVWKVSQPYRSGDTLVYTQTDQDGLGRPVVVTNPDGSLVQYAYAGNTVVQTDEAGNQRRYTSNTLGQLTKVEEPNPNLASPLETDYSYYVFGPLAQVTQTGSLTRTFTANWLGRVTEESHPESGTTDYTYDDGGLVTSRTDARSILTEYGYDDIGRLLSVNYHDSTPDVTYTYDAGSYAGLLTSVAVDGVTSSSFAYDNAGQLTSEAVTLTGVTGTFTTAYTYDLAGRLLHVTYPSGRVVAAAYAVSGGIAGDRLATLHDGPTNVDMIQSTVDNAAGAMTSRTLSSGISETRSFNERNQLTNIAASASSATLLDLGYEYGGSRNNGKIRARIDAVQPEHATNYDFDAIGRMTAVSGSTTPWNIVYDFDAYGNRLHQTPGGLASGPVVSQSIGYTNNKNNGYTYDYVGNITYDGTYHYYYDAENRVYAVGSTIQYAYDADGRRIEKTAGGVTTYSFYGLTGLTSEFSTSTSLSSATGADTTDRIQYRVGEQTGTGVMLIAADGIPRENNRVFPFGEPWISNAGSDNNEKFTSYQRDTETDLDYAMARYYAARSGRFMTSDPKHVGARLGDPQSWNGYLYTSNDPIDHTDANGLFTNSGHDVLGDDGTLFELPACGDVYVDGFLVGKTGGCPEIQGLMTNISKEKPPILIREPSKGWGQCKPAIAQAGKDLYAVIRARNSMEVLKKAVAGTSIDWSLVAAIGVRESGYRNIDEGNGGLGRGRFQIDGGQHSEISYGEAHDEAFSANFAAKLLNNNRNQIYAKTNGLEADPGFVNWMMVASYNTGAQGQINRLYGGYDPDWHSAPMGGGRYHDDYGSNVLGIQDCFN